MFDSMSASMPAVIWPGDNVNAFIGRGWFKVLQPQTRRWIINVNDVGGIISDRMIHLNDALAFAINSTASVSGKILYLLPFLVDTSSILAGIVPLYDPNKWGNVLNTDNTFGGGFTNSDITLATGLSSSSSTPHKYLSLKPLGEMFGAGNSGGITTGTGFIWYERNYSSPTNTECMGCYNPSVNTRQVMDLRTNAEFFSFGNVNNRATTSPTGAGNNDYYGESVMGVTNCTRVLYRNGTSVATNNTGDTGNSTLAMRFFASDDTTSILCYQGRCAVTGITNGTLGSTGASALHTIFSNYIITPTGR